MIASARIKIEDRILLMFFRALFIVQIGSNGHGYHIVAEKSARFFPPLAKDSKVVVNSD